ncbi:MAG TPA: protein-L-isoaspartate O-methyltransferase [Ruania sp.]|nr:protein-L-isoaspartate O-methyltransferase [Ruania sp.]
MRGAHRARAHRRRHHGHMAESGVDRAFEAVPRENFLPAPSRGAAHLDEPVELWARQTCSQPTTVHRMLTLLDPARGDRVLDVGSGSGWTTALLAQLVGPSGAVTGVEVIADLADWGAQNLAGAAMPWARIHHALPDQLGWPPGAPFDRILVSAEADDVPETLTEQLAEGGRMVIPVHEAMIVVDMREGAPQATRAPGAYRFVPLRDPGAD